MSKSKKSREPSTADRIYSIATEIEATLRHVGATGDPTSEHYANVVGDLSVAFAATLKGLAAELVTRDTVRGEHVALVNRMMLSIPTIFKRGEMVQPTVEQIAAYRANPDDAPEAVESEVRYDVIAWRVDHAEPVNVDEHIGLTLDELRTRVGVMGARQ